MKSLIILSLLAMLVTIYFLNQGRKSAGIVAPVISGGKLPLCNNKPNCVCSQQSATDTHHIDPISINDLSIDTVKAAIDKLGGTVISADSNQLHATFTSSIFGFVDDLLLSKQGGELNVRSSSRVGHSDFGANRKRVEQLRRMLAQNATGL